MRPVLVQTRASKEARSDLLVGLYFVKKPLRIEYVYERCVQLRRLYSTFAGGWPGIGLILMRLAVGIALVNSAAIALLSGPAIPMTVLSILLATAAILLVIGLYTPIVGTFVAVIEFCRVAITSADRLLYLLLATIGVALALLGPGLWSVDARLFGWKRIEPLPRKR